MSNQPRIISKAEFTGVVQAALEEARKHPTHPQDWTQAMIVENQIIRALGAALHAMGFERPWRPSRKLRCGTYDESGTRTLTVWRRTNARCKAGTWWTCPSCTLP